jgi:2-polyprenyl-3-methyl-5-hydroxy-6-metoxy-1,4-benzoquinol methylase
MIRYSACPACNSPEITFHLACRDHFLTGEEFILFRCGICGLVFTQDHPGVEEIGRYYSSEEYVSHSDTSKGIVNKLYKAARSFMLKSKKSIVIKKTGISRGSILDIGCGTGYFANEMKQAGWEVKGIEPDEKAAGFASSKFGLDVLHPGKISSLPRAVFDCITLWHVLEHFQDPSGYLMEISELLKPGGLCIAALPNCSSYDAEHYKSYWAAYDVPRHIWHFQPSSFEFFIKKAGFLCEGIKSMPLDAFYISIISEKYKGSRIPFLKGMIYGKLFFLKSLFNVKRSSSLIYFLRRQ